MKSQLEQLSDNEYYVLVVGWGIFGFFTVRAVALRGKLFGNSVTIMTIRTIINEITFREKT